MQMSFALIFCRFIGVCRYQNDKNNKIKCNMLFLDKSMITLNNYERGSIYEKT